MRYCVSSLGAVCVLAAGFFIAGPSFAQVPEGDQGASEDRKRCDSAWDGALFGILPGVLAAMVWPGTAFLDETEEGLSSSEALVMAGAVGASVGFAIDIAACRPQRTKSSETVALLARIRRGERIRRISVVTKEDARFALMEPFVRDGTLLGFDAIQSGQEIVLPLEDIRHLSVPTNRTAYMIVGVVAGVVALYTWEAYSNDE